MNRWILLLCCVLSLVCSSLAADSLLYWISTGGTTAKDASKTEIFVVNIATGKQRLAFSDAHAQFLLLPGDDTQLDVVTAAGRIFSRGMDRKLYANAGADNPAAIFELSTNGSGKARKLFDISPETGMGSNVRNLFVSPNGEKVGYIRLLGGKPYLFIHETSSGHLLRKADLTQVVFDLYVSNIGWMPDGKRLFFTLDRSEEDDNWRLPDSQVGSYLINEDGSGAVRVAPEPDLHPQRPGLQGDPAVAALLLGTLPGGQWLVRDTQMGPPPARPGTYFYALSLVGKTQKELPVRVPGQLQCFRVSPSGNTLAMVAAQRTDETPGSFKSTKAVWVFDLESNKERQMLSFTAQNGPPAVGLIGWFSRR